MKKIVWIEHYYSKDCNPICGGKWKVSTCDPKKVTCSNCVRIMKSRGIPHNPKFLPKKRRKEC